MSSAMPQEKQAHEPCKVQCFQVEEEPKSPQLLDSTKKVQSTKKQVQRIKSVGKESVEVQSDGKGDAKSRLEGKLSVEEIYNKSMGTWNYYQC